MIAHDLLLLSDREVSAALDGLPSVDPEVGWDEKFDIWVCEDGSVVVSTDPGWTDSGYAQPEFEAYDSLEAFTRAWEADMGEIDDVHVGKAFPSF